jgi:hypothetical protein
MRVDSFSLTILPPEMDLSPLHRAIRKERAL